MSDLNRNPTGLKTWEAQETDYQKYDDSRLGLERYKWLAYNLVLQSKQSIEFLASMSDGRGCHTWQELIAIMAGNNNLIRNPRQYIC